LHRGWGCAAPRRRRRSREAVTDGTEGAGFAGRPPGSRVLLGGRGPSIIAFRVVLLAASVVPAAGRGGEESFPSGFMEDFFYSALSLVSLLA